MATVKTLRVKTIAEFHRMKGLEPPLHPLVSIVDYSQTKCDDDIGAVNYIFDFYNISVKRGIGAKFKYGQQQYDFDEGILFFLGPNQVFGIEPVTCKTVKRSGWMLLIHPDFLWQTSLAKEIRQHEFFSYKLNEALFLSDKEEKILNSIIENIAVELRENTDAFSHSIIVSHIEALLRYSARFYRRQFLTREFTSNHMVSRVHEYLDVFFEVKACAERRLPTVQDLATSLNISQGYLSNLLKATTGLNTQQHIHERLITLAKEKLSATGLTVGEIAFELGFEHPQSFSKFFKSKTNESPVQFRSHFN